MHGDKLAAERKCQRFTWLRSCGHKGKRVGASEQIQSSPLTVPNTIWNEAYCGERNMKRHRKDFANLPVVIKLCGICYVWRWMGDKAARDLSPLRIRGANLRPFGRCTEWMRCDQTDGRSAGCGGRFSEFPFDSTRFHSRANFIFRRTSPQKKPKQSINTELTSSPSTAFGR